MRRRVWQWSVAVWGVLVIGGGLLTLALQGGGDGRAADPGSGSSDRPVSTSTDLPCPAPPGEEEGATLRACAGPVAARGGDN